MILQRWPAAFMGPQHAKSSGSGQGSGLSSGKAGAPRGKDIDKERVDNKGTIGKASEPSERDRSTLREENLDPTLGSEGATGQSIGSGQPKGPSSGLGPKQPEE